MQEPGRLRPPTPRIALALAIVLGAAACLESTIVQIDVTDVVLVRLSPDSATLPLSGTFQLAATPVDETGALIVVPSVVWTSLAPLIASVDELGLVTGVGIGETRVIARVGTAADTSVVTVALPPVLVLSDTLYTFAAEAGLSDPPPDSVLIGNGGAFPLVGIALDSIAYSGPAPGWLAASLRGSGAPTILDLEVMIGSLTEAGLYHAVVWISAPGAVDSPARVKVELDMAAGLAAAIVVNDGDGQSAQVGTAVATAPSVRVADAFGNPVSGAQVSFAATAGGGSVAGSPATTDASGVARVGSWTLGTLKGANALDATLPSVGTVSFAATGTPGPATRLQITAGDGQSAVAGSAVANAPQVVALDAFDNGVQGVGVVFSVATGGGSIGGATQSTDSNGLATSGAWTLGAATGTNTVLAAAGAIPDTVTFTATGLPGGLDELVLVAGDAQTDTVGATLPVQYAVRVEDVNNNGIPDITVSWAVTGGGGSLPGTSVTDATGVARATRVLGQGAGAQTGQASVGGLGTVAFTATANPGTPSRLVVVAGSGQSATVGTNVGVAPIVRVTDGFDNAIAGHSVTFAVTKGAVSPAGARLTAADGTAALSSWTLGTAAAAASDTLSVTPAGGSVTPNPLRLVATALVGPPSSITVQSGNGQSAVTGSQLAAAPTVRVADQYGNPIANRRVDFSASAGSSVGAAADTTGATGLAFTTWTVSVTGSTADANGRFPHALTATVPGTSLSTSFTGYAVYSWATHVYPILSSFNCQDCHGHNGNAANGLFFTNTATQLYLDLVGFPSVCDPSFDRISDVGGAGSDDVLSVLVRYNDTGLTNPGTCGGHPAALSTGDLTVIKPWIRNGALNN